MQLLLLALLVGLGVYLGRKSKEDGPSVFDPGPVPKTLEAESEAIDDKTFREEITKDQSRQAASNIQLDAAEADLHAKGISTTRVGNNVIPSEQPLTKAQERKRYQEWVARNMGKQKGQ